MLHMEIDLDGSVHPPPPQTHRRGEARGPDHHAPRATRRGKAAWRKRAMVVREAWRPEVGRYLEVSRAVRAGELLFQEAVQRLSARGVGRCLGGWEVQRLRHSLG